MYTCISFVFIFRRLTFPICAYSYINTDHDDDDDDNDDDDEHNHDDECVVEDGEDCDFVGDDDDDLSRHKMRNKICPL